MVSIIVPIYNCEKYLKECLESLCNQTLCDIEIILVNDGSTDKSVDICLDYKNKDDRILILSQENGGVSSARNKGIQFAKGEYLVFVDSDDYVAPDYIEKLYHSIANTNSDIAICGCIEVSESARVLKNVNGEIIQGKYEIAKFFCNNYLSGCGVAAPWAKMYKKSKICNLFDDKLSYGEDILFNICYFKNIARISMIAENLYYYRKVQGSLSSTYKDTYYEGQKKIYIQAMEYIQHVEMYCQRALQKDNIALKFYKQSTAFIVKQCMIKNRAKDKTTSYIKQISEDIVFCHALPLIKKQSLIDRIMIRSIRHKWYACIYVIARTRACYKLITNRYRI